MIMVDNTEVTDNVQQFGYKNKYGIVEYIGVDLLGHEDTVEIADEQGDYIQHIYIEDIPKMIKALQAAYNFAMEDK